jgi:hypothetical protein
MSWIYLTGMIVMASILLIVDYKSPWMRGLSAGIHARIIAQELVLIFLWPVVFVIIIVIFILSTLGFDVTIE